MNIETKTGEPFGLTMANRSPEHRMRVLRKLALECEVCGYTLTKREYERERRKKTMMCAECRSDYNDFAGRR